MACGASAPGVSKWNASPLSTSVSGTGSTQSSTISPVTRGLIEPALVEASTTCSVFCSGTASATQRPAGSMGSWTTAELEGPGLEQLDGGGNVVERGEAGPGSPQPLEPAGHGGPRLGHRRCGATGGVGEHLAVATRRRRGAVGTARRGRCRIRSAAGACRAVGEASQALGCRGQRRRRRSSPRSGSSVSGRNARRAPAAGRARPTGRRTSRRRRPSCRAPPGELAVRRPEPVDDGIGNRVVGIGRVGGHDHVRLVDVEIDRGERSGVGEQAAQRGGQHGELRHRYAVGLAHRVGEVDVDGMEVAGGVDERGTRQSDAVLQRRRVPVGADEVHRVEAVRRRGRRGSPPCESHPGHRATTTLAASGRRSRTNRSTAGRGGQYAGRVAHLRGIGFDRFEGDAQAVGDGAASARRQRDIERRRRHLAGGDGVERRRRPVEVPLDDLVDRLAVVTSTTASMAASRSSSGPVIAATGPIAAASAFPATPWAHRPASTSPSTGATAASAARPVASSTARRQRLDPHVEVRVVEGALDAVTHQVAEGDTPRARRRAARPQSAPVPRRDRRRAPSWAGRRRGPSTRCAGWRR